MRLLRGRHLGDCDHEVCEVVLADAALHCRGGPGLILIAPLLPPGAQSSSPLPLSCPTSPFRCPCCTPLLPSFDTDQMAVLLQGLSDMQFHPSKVNACLH